MGQMKTLGTSFMGGYSLLEYGTFYFIDVVIQYFDFILEVFSILHVFVRGNLSEVKLIAFENIVLWRQY